MAPRRAGKRYSASRGKGVAKLPSFVVPALYPGVCSWCSRTYKVGDLLSGVAGFDWVHWPKCYHEAKPMNTGLTNGGRDYRPTGDD